LSFKQVEYRRFPYQSLNKDADILENIIAICNIMKGSNKVLSLEKKRIWLVNSNQLEL